MSDSVYAAVLQSARQELLDARKHLSFSIESVSSVAGAGKWSELELEKVEAFTSRFARVVDLLINRVLRAIDRYELIEPGTLLDTANRAEARGLIPGVDWLRELKDVRNRIAHDYAGLQLPDLFVYCQRVIPALEQTCVRVDNYIDQLL
ncbi:MAG: HepT-like ribonuclease domain-containing protein [Opitutales bacterium]